MDSVSAMKKDDGYHQKGRWRAYQDREIPIYMITNSLTAFQTKLPTRRHHHFKTQTTSQATLPLEYYAQGSLIGYFYIIQERVTINNVRFMGKFEGALQEGGSQVYFEGSIDRFYLIAGDMDPLVFKELQRYETSFKGYFRGYFYRWPSLGDVSQGEELLLEAARVLDNPDYSKEKDRINDLSELGKQERQNIPEIFLPTLVRFEVEDIREVKLQKSLGVISGIFHIEIHYNDIVKKLVKDTSLHLRRMRQSKQKSFQKFLKIELHFQRDFNLTLDLEEKDPDGAGDKSDSEGSEWSIMDKTWDISFEDDEKRQIYRFRVWKRFNAEIDNSYGSFFAPFNLNTLRIVLDMNSFLVRGTDELQLQREQSMLRKSIRSCEFPFNTNIRVNLVGVNPDEDNPFIYFNSLPPECQAARNHKINRLRCRNSGTYMIADNRMILFPFYRNVLINKNTANEKISWTLGLADKYQLIANPTVRSIRESFQYYEKNRNIKVQAFTFQKWQYVIIEVPIFKYIVIDMLLVFIPLFLLSAISLLIYDQTNGISSNSGFTTLAYRLVNVSSMMIAYVSLVPVIQENLPPMPGITLVEVLTYLCTVPNFLSLLSSMMHYTSSLLSWQVGYKIFSDWVFLVAFIVSLFNFVVLLSVFLVYACKDYCAVRPDVRLLEEIKKPEVNLPNSVKFMEGIISKREKQYQIQKISHVKLS